MENTVQNGHSADMIFPIAELIAHVSRFFYFEDRDILFTGMPVGGQSGGRRQIRRFYRTGKMFDFKVKKIQLALHCF